MTDDAHAPAQPTSPIPPDDLNRQLTIADPDGAGTPHVSIAGGAYTILLSGPETAGRYRFIDMLVPPGGGPPPHRHDFEEMFTLLDGELEFTFRGQTQSQISHRNPGAVTSALRQRRRGISRRSDPPRQR